MGNLILGRKKTKEEREEEAKNLRKRAHFVTRKGQKATNEEFVVGNEEEDDFLKLQNEYYKDKDANGANFDMKRYQPIHAEKYRASQPDDF